MAPNFLWSAWWFIDLFDAKHFLFRLWTN